VPKAEALLSASPLTPEVIARAATAAMETAKPISDVRSSAEYRKAMVRVLTRRAIEQVSSSKFTVQG
jgi:carbon-monoxide dehydrogenase medium subunit